VEQSQFTSQNDDDCSKEKEKKEGKSKICLIYLFYTFFGERLQKIPSLFSFSVPLKYTCGTLSRKIKLFWTIDIKVLV